MVGSTRDPYGYAHGDPVDEEDPTGQNGGPVCGATNRACKSAHPEIYGCQTGARQCGGGINWRDVAKSLVRTFRHNAQEIAIGGLATGLGVVDEATGGGLGKLVEKGVKVTASTLARGAGRFVAVIEDLSLAEQSFLLGCIGGVGEGAYAAIHHNWKTAAGAGGVGLASCAVFAITVAE